MAEKLRIGILGCGAIAQLRHIPTVLTNAEQVTLSALVDVDSQRATTLCKTYGLTICQVAEDFRSIGTQVDAVINALPHNLHAEANLFFLNNRVHVLCEKPLTITAREARACCECADRNGVVLAAAMPWHFRQSTRLLQMVLADGTLGSVRDYDWEYGMPYDWHGVSGFVFSKEKAGGGVLLDEGIHLLHCVFHWFGSVADFDYQDDDWGSGLEANALLHLQHRNGIRGRIRLSRTYELGNRLSVKATQGSAEINRAHPEVLVLYHSIAGEKLPLRMGDETNATDLFQSQFDDFVQSIKQHRQPAVDGKNAAACIELVEQCYVQKKRLAEPWAV